MRKPGDPTISTDVESGETLLGRWSRRKRSGAAGTGADELPLPPAEQDPDQRPEHEQSSAVQAEPTASVPACAEDAGSVPVLTDADMPPLDSIAADGDYSGFMSPGVSEGLRNKALRRLFMSAQFNVLDGLDDYDDDFTTYEALGDIVTADMRHRVEMEAEKAARETEVRGLPPHESGRQALGVDQGVGQESSEQDTRERGTDDEHVDGVQTGDADTIEAHESDVREPVVSDTRVIANSPGEPAAHDDRTVVEKHLLSATPGTARSDGEDV
jgi:hypothetical protein